MFIFALSWVCFELIISLGQIVDLHLRTKADLYSFMQCSFVKIQDLIGYVSEYMLMLPKRPIKQLMYADYLLWYGSNYCLPLKIPFPGRYYRCICRKRVYLAGVYSKYVITWNSIVFCPDWVWHVFLVRHGGCLYASKCTICYCRWVSLSKYRRGTQFSMHVLKSYTCIGGLS
jgi:hypothetical protein